MSKKAVMISIDEFIHKEAKDSYINVSDVCERAIREKLNGSISDSKEERVCKLCGEQGKIWLCPGEYWICDKCWKGETQKIIIGIVPT